MDANPWALGFCVPDVGSLGVAITAPPEKRKSTGKKSVSSRIKPLRTYLLVCQRSNGSNPYASRRRLRMILENERLGMKLD